MRKVLFWGATFLICCFPITGWAGIGKWQAHWLWINGNIPYEVDPSCPVGEKLIEQALLELEKQTDNTLTFKRSSSLDLDAVRFGALKDNDSAPGLAVLGEAAVIGRYPGERWIGLSPQADARTIQHEVMHLAGLLHEEDRTDRPFNQRYRTEPIVLTRLANSQTSIWDFPKDVKVFTNYFDSDSLMHSRRPNQNAPLSQGDIDSLKVMYAQAKRSGGYLFRVCGRFHKELVLEEEDAGLNIFGGGKQVQNTYYTFITNSEKSVKYGFTSYRGWRSQEQNTLFEAWVGNNSIKEICVSSNILTPSPQARPRVFRSNRMIVPDFRSRLDKVEIFYQGGEFAMYQLHRTGIAERGETELRKMK